MFYKSEDEHTLSNGVTLSLCLPVDQEIEFFVNLTAKCNLFSCVMGLTLEDDLLNIYAQDQSSIFPDDNAKTQH